MCHVRHRRRGGACSGAAQRMVGWSNGEIAMDRWGSGSVNLAQSCRPTSRRLGVTFLLGRFESCLSSDGAAG